MTKFAANNNKLASIKLSLFFATKGLHLCISFDIMKLFDTCIRERIFKQKAFDTSRNLKITWKFLRKALAVAQKSLSKQTNKYQKDITYIVGDKVWLSTRNITSNQLSMKLDYKMLGFFKVIRNKRVAVWW